MDKQEFWTRIRKDAAEAMCTDVKYLVWGVHDIQREVLGDTTFPVYHVEDNYDYLLRVICSKVRYSRLRDTVEKRFPGLCEFGVSP